MRNIIDVLVYMATCTGVRAATSCRATVFAETSEEQSSDAAHRGRGACWFSRARQRYSLKPHWQSCSGLLQLAPLAMASQQSGLRSQPDIVLQVHYLRQQVAVIIGKLATNVGVLGCVLIRGPVGVVLILSLLLPPPHFGLCCAETESRTSPSGGALCDGRIAAAESKAMEHGDELAFHA